MFTVLGVIKLGTVNIMVGFFQHIIWNLHLLGKEGSAML